MDEHHQGPFETWGQRMDKLMTEHVHKWEWIYRPDGIGPRYIGCQCGEPMQSDEIFKRVQATERLSAEDAVKVAYEYGSMNKYYDILMAYADILEGK